MSTLSVDTGELRKLGLPHRLLLRVLNWIKEEYRLTTYAHIRWKAEKGDAMAQHVLGTMCDAGNGVFQTGKEAVKWYQKAAYQGVAQAQLALGLKYLEGQGVSQSDSEALLWFRKAAEQGQAEAQFHLGNLYHEGRGTPRDLLQAGKWYRKAADRGHTDAKKNFKALSSVNFSAPVPQDPTEQDQRLVA